MFIMHKTNYNSKFTSDYFNNTMLYRSYLQFFYKHRPNQIKFLQLRILPNTSCKRYKWPLLSCCSTILLIFAHFNSQNHCRWSSIIIISQQFRKNTSNVYKSKEMSQDLTYIAQTKKREIECGQWLKFLVPFLDFFVNL